MPAGPGGFLYNLPRDIVLGVRFVTPQGNIPGSGGKTVKNVSGYDVSKLMVGSMGSLGIITEMTFRLLPLPEKMKTLLVSFDTFEAAQTFCTGILKSKLIPAAVETMNATAYENLDFTGAPDFKSADSVVAVSLEAFVPAVDRMEKEMLETANACGSVSAETLKENEHLQFWLAISDQQAALAAKYTNLIRAKVNCRIFEWKDIFAFAKKSLTDLKIKHVIRAHSGSGICYINLLLDENSNGLKNQAVSFLEQLLQRSRKAGGNTVIQNAPTDMKTRIKVWGETGTDIVAMKMLKTQLDPNGVMSPGRFVGGL